MKKWIFKELSDYHNDLLGFLPDLLKHFNVDSTEYSNMYAGCCPIHDGDNISAFNIYKNTGRWYCRSHGCHEVFRSTLIGLVRGLLSNQKHNWRHVSDKTVSFEVTMRFIKKFLANREDLQPVQRTKSVTYNIPPSVELDLSIGDFMSQVECPPQYYLKRGFSREVLEYFKVGLFKKYNHPAHNRILVPILSNNNKKVIGYTGRSIYDKCYVCGGYHEIGNKCADPKTNPWAFQKWKHNKGFRKTDYLYNFWNSQTFIEDFKEIIIVEGPSDVWKLQESQIYNSVGIFGSSLSYKQKELINSLDVPNIKVITDNDEAGHKCYKKIVEQLPSHSIVKLTPPRNDLGDMTKEEIRKLITDGI